MKKLLSTIVACILTLGCLFMVGCSSPVGSYKFESMSAATVGVEFTVKAGEDYFGFTLTEDYLTLDLKEDGTGFFAMQGEGENITWVKENDVIKVSAYGETIEFKIDGKKLLLESEGYVFTLTK